MQSNFCFSSILNLSAASRFFHQLLRDRAALLQGAVQTLACDPRLASTCQQLDMHARITRAAACATPLARAISPLNFITLEHTVLRDAYMAPAACVLAAAVRRRRSFDAPLVRYRGLRFGLSRVNGHPNLQFKGPRTDTMGIPVSGLSPHTVVQVWGRAPAPSSDKLQLYAAVTIHDRVYPCVRGGRLAEMMDTLRAFTRRSLEQCPVCEGDLHPLPAGRGREDDPCCSDCRDTHLAAFCGLLFRWVAWRRRPDALDRARQASPDSYAWLVASALDSNRK